MAHIPLIHGPDGAKLSKRHGALGVEAYRAMGYCRPALRNYLVRLGCGATATRRSSHDEMVALFDLKNVGRSAARFDYAKLSNLNGHYMRQTEDKALLAALEEMLPHVEGGRISPTPSPAAGRTVCRHDARPPRSARRRCRAAGTARSFLFATRPLKLD